MTVEEFVTTRVGCAIVNGKLILQQTPESTIPWMKTELGLSDEDIETTIRGGIFKHRISICVGSNYECADMSKFPADAFITLLQIHEEKYPGSDVNVFNGQKIGDTGEDWEQIEFLGRFQSLPAIYGS